MTRFFSFVKFLLVKPKKHIMIVQAIEIPDDFVDEMLDGGYDWIFTARGRYLHSCVPIGFCSIRTH